MADRPARVTIRDVARSAGVSISTVSHAFSGARTISAATRSRVEQAARELGYDPDPSARTLRTGRSDLIGLLLRPQFAVTGTRDRAETFNRLLGAVSTEVLRRGRAVVHVPDLDQFSGPVVPMDGCIVAHPYADDSVVKRLLSRGVPTVTIDDDPTDDGTPWTVSLDYEGPLRAALDALRRAGAERIALIAGTEDNAWNRISSSIYAAWCAEAGLTPRREVLSEGSTDADAESMLTRLLASPDRPDALVVLASDYAAAAAGVAGALQLDVPQDLMICSLSDSEHTRRAHPPITAIDLNHEELAARAVELMFALLDGAPTPSAPAQVSPVLRLRGSTRGEPTDGFRDSSAVP